MWESLCDLGTTFRSHKTLATNCPALLALGFKMTRKAKRSTKMARRCSYRHHGTDGCGGHTPESRPAPPHAAASAVPAVNRQPARGQCLAVSLAANSAPTLAALRYCSGSGDREAAWGVASRPPQHGQGFGSSRKAAYLQRLPAFLRGGRPFSIHSAIIMMILFNFQT